MGQEVTCLILVFLLQYSRINRVKPSIMLALFLLMTFWTALLSGKRKRPDRPRFAPEHQIGLYRTRFGITFIA